MITFKFETFRHLIFKLILTHFHTHYLKISYLTLNYSAVALIAISIFLLINWYFLIYTFPIESCRFHTWYSGNSWFATYRLKTYHFHAFRFDTCWIYTFQNCTSIFVTFILLTQHGFYCRNCSGDICNKPMNNPSLFWSRRRDTGTLTNN